MLPTILILLLILLFAGSLPKWRYSADWGYGPGGAVGAILALVIVLAMLERI